MAAAPGSSSSLPASTVDAALPHQPPSAPRPLQSDGRLHGVIVAIRRSDGRLLCIRRSALVTAPLKVCFPGGAMETGESQTQAVIREMTEELGIDVTPIRQCWRWDAPDRPLTLWGWIAEVREVDALRLRPAAAEVAEVLWLAPREAIEHPDAIGTNRDFVNCLESIL